MSLETIAKQLAQLIKDNDKKTPKAYDTQATVTRIEGGTAWVHIAGGVDETPVKRTIACSEGDSVQVRVSGGRAWITGNASAPPTDDAQANIATERADRANKTAIAAQDTADMAVDDAARAKAAADSAEGDAQRADEAAQSATKSANSALGQLSIVEDVVDTLTWLTKHGTIEPTTDTSAQQDKVYYTRSGAGTEADPYTYEVVTEPEEDPSAAGYYELTGVDAAVSNYVSSHLALTGRGLYVTNDDTAGKVLLSTNGVELINEKGDTVATYGTNTVIGDEESVHLKIEATELGFYDGNERVAYISNNELYIPRVVVVDSMQVGNRADGAWQWVVDDDSRNLRLMWIGG